MLTLTPEQLTAQATAIRNKRAGGSRIIALQYSGTWSGPSNIRVAGEDHRVIACVSDLHMRQALRDLQDGDEPAILLCTFDPSDLGEDVLARLTKRRIYQPQTEEIVRELFSVRFIDGSLLASKPLLLALIQHAGEGAYPAAPGGLLDMNAAWKALLRNVLKREFAELTFQELLRWSTDPNCRTSLKELDPKLREELAQWLEPSSGGAARFLLRALGTDLAGNLIAVGLLFGLMLSAKAHDLPEAAAGAARLEHLFGDEPVPLEAQHLWFKAAESLLLSLAEVEFFETKEVLQSLDRLIERVRLQPYAALSDYSALGLEQRLSRIAKDLRLALSENEETSILNARTSFENAEKHFLAANEVLRLRRLQMAMRLFTWARLPSSNPPPRVFSELVQAYYRDGGFVDWARNLVSESDPNTEVKQCLQGALGMVDEKWREFEQSFVEALHSWTAGAQPLNCVLKIEEALHSVVAPVAREHPALLVVLDGMSMAVFRELMTDLLRRNWVEVDPTGGSGSQPVLATIPSTTEVSRRALLSGQLPIPSDGNEKSDFSKNDRLHERVGGSQRPLLFLKGDLSDGIRPGLSNSVVEAISSQRCRLIGVVVNAVDDTLGAADQTSFTWTLDQITPLHELLRLASEAGRVVILASDHGHVLDGGSERVAQPWDESGDRYRSPGGTLHEFEKDFRGPRIRAATNSESVIALSEPSARYHAKRRGYHGGACPAELVVPCVVIRHATVKVPTSWKDQPPYEPTWWTLRPQTAVARLEQDLLLPKVSERSKKQPELFEAPRPSTSQSWIDALLKSPVYKQQAKRAVRGTPASEQTKQFLQIFDQRNGSVLRGQLAQYLGLPLFRVEGLVQNYRRLFNLDGYDVLSYDNCSETITLNIQLLKNQFELTE